jgi:hypothetical protein
LEEPRASKYNPPQAQHGLASGSERAMPLLAVSDGPDARTRIGPATPDVLHAVYAPAGAGPEAMRRHLAQIQDVVLRVSPGGVTRGLEVHVSGATA